MKIAEEAIYQIKAHGERTYPEECCGVMLGAELEHGREVQSIIEIDNSQEENRKRRFFVTPEQYRDAERAAAEQQKTLLGFYHSHPDHPAKPSAFDTEHALPWFSYIIVSVLQGRADKVTSWRLSQDRGQFEENPLSVLPVPVRISR